MTNETTKSQNNVHQLSHNLLAGDKSCSFFHSDSFVSGKSLVIFEEIESWWKLQKGKNVSHAKSECVDEELKASDCKVGA